MFSSTSSTQAGGVAIFMREGLFNNCHLIHKDKQGKLIIIDFFYNNKSCRLINIHAPNIDTHRKKFFIGLRQWIVTNCIIIGDFNITLTKSDISNNCTFSEDYSRNTLFDIITQNSLIDIWRLFHPGKKQFTRKQVILGKLKQSRLDFLLVLLPLKNFTLRDTTKCPSMFCPHKEARLTLRRSKLNPTEKHG
uniref:Endonuclease/exonuclease/phosphatase domain-containing protein n=1 Tax=Xiphophorus maculatus TaxID=8083 RepID=A0A3B5QCH1_XIPMA